MLSSVPFLAPSEDADLINSEDADLDAWICADELPWNESWDEFTASEFMEPLAILERMPSEQELLAIEAQPEDAIEIEVLSAEALALDEY